jgi:rare lipoprotein A (peptidoglycan hydrolase)
MKIIFLKSYLESLIKTILHFYCRSKNFYNSNFKKALIILIIFALSSCKDNTSYVYNSKKDGRFSNLEKRHKILSPNNRIEFINNSINASNNYYYDNLSEDYNKNPDFSDEEQNLDSKQSKDLQEISNNFVETGLASWYGSSLDGKKTTNGETYNHNDLTAAHPTLPLPSMIIVTNLENGNSIRVRVNDRGPSSKNRIIDVSKKAAMELGFLDKGIANVKIELLK